jgi:hypothetical protein
MEPSDRHLRFVPSKRRGRSSGAVRVTDAAIACVIALRTPGWYTSGRLVNNNQLRAVPDAS